MMQRELTDKQAAAWASYQRMRARLSGRLNRELARKTGLSEADFEILVALLESPDEPMRALALRCGLEWEKAGSLTNSDAWNKVDSPCARTAPKTSGGRSSA